MLVTTIPVGQAISKDDGVKLAVRTGLACPDILKESVGEPAEPPVTRRVTELDVAEYLRPPAHRTVDVPTRQAPQVESQE